jgi:hypothetical protein
VDKEMERTILALRDELDDDGKVGFEADLRGQVPGGGVADVHGVSLG